MWRAARVVGPRAGAVPDYALIGVATSVSDLSTCDVGNTPLARMVCSAPARRVGGV